MHLGLSRALEIRELALLEDRLGGVRRGRAPGRARLLQAEVGQRRADVDYHGPLERVVRVRGVEF